MSVFHGLNRCFLLYIHTYIHIREPNLGIAMIYVALATLSHILYGRSMVYSSNDVRFLPENLILRRVFRTAFNKIVYSSWARRKFSGTLSLSFVIIESSLFL